MAIRSYKDLLAWQESIDLAEAIYQRTEKFPKAEVFGLTAQIRRAGTSVASNIAEGHARSSTRDFLRFVSMALGSLAELETQVILATRLTYLSREMEADLLKRADHIGRLLRGLQKSLRARIRTKLSPAPSP